MWKDGKYILSYITPLTGYFSLYMGGWWAFSTIIYGFVIMPLLEIVTSNATENLEPQQEKEESHRSFFDWVVYLNLPLVFGIAFYYFYLLANAPLQTYEIVGMTLGTGLILGGIGINAAHELGHRDNKMEQFLSKVLLIPVLYMHFFVEHNRGHHKNVATPLDPATSRYGEILYTFWFRTVWGSYWSAWHLENKRLRAEGKSAFHWQNEMIHYHYIQAAYLLLVGFLFGWWVIAMAILVGVLGFLLLETINYVEHYGLMRRQLPSGMYEPVQPHHSWNSSQILGRIMLYELPRHSDHHYKANRKYQILRHYHDSPQLPFGYPTLVLISFFPPLWFWIMNPRVRQWQQAFGNGSSNNEGQSLAVSH